MFAYGEKHPVLFEVILFILAMIVAMVFTIAGSLFYLPTEISSSIGRIIAAIVLFFVYRRAFQDNTLFKDPVYVLPILLFVVWNLYYNLSNGARFGDGEVILAGVITALAPALFEEVIFRGIFIYNLKKHGFGNFAAALISAGLFAAVHLTNIAGMDLLSVLVQVVYSFVVGLVLAAIYLKNRSMTEIILAHWLIDFTSRIYIEPASATSTLQMVLFAVLLVLEAVYAVWLTKRSEA